MSLELNAWEKVQSQGRHLPGPVKCSIPQKRGLCTWVWIMPILLVLLASEHVFAGCPTNRSLCELRQKLFKNYLRTLVYTISLMCQDPGYMIGMIVIISPKYSKINQGCLNPIHIVAVCGSWAVLATSPWMDMKGKICAHCCDMRTATKANTHLLVFSQSLKWLHHSVDWEQSAAFEIEKLSWGKD